MRQIKVRVLAAYQVAALIAFVFLLLTFQNCTKSFSAAEFEADEAMSDSLFGGLKSPLKKWHPDEISVPVHRWVKSTFIHT